MNTSKALTWNELADIYNESTGGHARTLEMNTVFEWAEKQTDKFFVSSDGTLHKITQANYALERTQV